MLPKLLNHISKYVTDLEKYKYSNMGQSVKLLFQLTKYNLFFVIKENKRWLELKLCGLYPSAKQLYKNYNVIGKRKHK